MAGPQNHNLVSDIIGELRPLFHSIPSKVFTFHFKQQIISTSHQINSPESYYMSETLKRGSCCKVLSTYQRGKTTTRKRGRKGYMGKGGGE